MKKLSSCDCAPLMKAINVYLLKTDIDLEDTLNNAGFIEAKETIKKISLIEEQLTEALINETEYITNAVDETNSLNDFSFKWQDIKIKDKLSLDVEKIFADEFTVLIPKLANSYIKLTDTELEITGMFKRTTAWIQSWSNQLGEYMKLDSHKQIEDILSTGLKEGQGITEFTQSILNSGIRNEYYKARRVAMTEVLRAHSYASNEAIMQSPAVDRKEWVHTGSYRIAPRANHEAMNGSIVLKSEPFILEGVDGKIYYPYLPKDTVLPPGESINCHCIHRGIVSDDVLGMSLEERRALQQKAIDEDDGEWEKELDAKNRAKSGIDETYSKKNLLSFDNDILNEKVITEENIISSLQTSEIGKDTVKYIEDNYTTVHISNEVVMKGLAGESIPSLNYMTVYKSENKSSDAMAKTIIHETTHIKYNIGGNQWAEAQCLSAERIHEKGELTISDKRDIIKTVKDNYSEYGWRKK